MCQDQHQQLGFEGVTSLAPRYKDPDSQLHTNRKIDSLRSWITCFACALLICGGSVGFRCSGLLLVAISDEFGIPRGHASWPSSITNLMMLFSGVIVGPLAQRFPLRPLLIAGVFVNGLGFILGAFVPNVALMTLAYGAIHGFGSGAILIVVNILLTQHFDRYRGLAFGIAHAASPVASFTFPSLITFIMERLNFRYAMLTVGVLLLSFTPVACFIKEESSANLQRSNDDESRPAETKTAKPVMLAWSVFKEPMFYTILAANLVFQWTFDTFLATIVDYATQRGLAVQDAIIIIACYSITDIIGRVCLPAIADWGFLGRDSLLAVSYFLSCGLLSLLCFCTNLISFIALIFCLGPFFGLAGTYYYSLVERYLGIERLPFTYGMMGTISGTVFLFMPPAIGLFRDSLGDYRWMYAANCTLLFLTSIPWLFVIIRRKMSQSSKASTVIQ